MSALKKTRTPIKQSTPQASYSNRLAHLLKVALNTTLPTEARLLYVILCLMAWSKGYCFPSQQTQAEGLGRSERQVRRLLKTLEAAELLRIQRGGGLPTRYYPAGVQPEDTSVKVEDTGGGEKDRGDRITLKENLKDVKNVLSETPVTTPNPKPNVNASPRPHREMRKSISAIPGHRNDLVREIEQVTGDTWSTGWFLKLVRNNDQQTVRMALSITRDKMAQDSGVNGGAYFTATVKNLAGVQPFHSSPRRHVEEKSPAIIPAPTPAVEKPRSIPPVQPPAVKFHEEPEPPNPEGIINGLHFHWRNEGLSGLLTWAERSVVGINTREIFAQIKELLPEARERELVDRFLQTVLVRMKHRETRAGSVA